MTTEPQTEVLGADGKPLPDDSTDPLDPKSHPPYYTKLEIAKINSIAFQMRFMSIDVDVRNKVTTAAINTITLDGRTQFVVVGDMIPRTTYKVESYKEVMVKDANGGEQDHSILTVVNTKNGQKVDLQKGLVVNSPESNIELRFTWVPPGGQPAAIMTLEKDKTFKLPPEPDKEYKLIEIKPTAQTALGQVTTGEATILLPGGQKLVLKFPAPPAPK